MRLHLMILILGYLTLYFIFEIGHDKTQTALVDSTFERFRRSGNKAGIPNIIHFVIVHLNPDHSAPISFVQMLSIMSAAVVNQPDKLYLHTNDEPFGQWWEFLKPLVTVRLISELPMFWGNKRIIRGAHVSDHVRLDVLLEEGGVYLDTDVISLRPLRKLWMNEEGELVLDGRGLPVEMIMGKENDDGLCNAVLISSPNSTFLKVWISEYEKTFRPGGWAEASVFLPKALSLRFPEIINVLPERAFFFPSWNNYHRLFDDKEIEITEDAYAYHLWSAPNVANYEDARSLFPLRNPPQNLFEKIIRFLSMTSSSWNKTVEEAFRSHEVS